MYALAGFQSPAQILAVTVQLTLSDVSILVILKNKLFNNGLGKQNCNSSLTSSQNDPLKGHTAGMKKDYSTPYKQESMKRQLEEGKQYYPTDNQGVIDEWGALAQHQDALWEAYRKQEKVKKKTLQASYAKELDAQKSMRQTKIEREHITRMTQEREANMAQNDFKKGFDQLKNEDKNNDRAALAAHYEQELRDKEKQAREMRAAQLREADGVKERIDTINAHEQQMANDKSN